MGRPETTRFLRPSFGWRGRRPFTLFPTRANGQPAFAGYLGDGSEATPSGLIVPTMSGDRISTITRFLSEGLLVRFGFAGEHAPAGAGSRTRADTRRRRAEGAIEPGRVSARADVERYFGGDTDVWFTVRVG